MELTGIEIKCMAQADGGRGIAAERNSDVLACHNNACSRTLGACAHPHY